MIADVFNYESLLVPLNRIFDLHTGGRKRPVFFDIDQTRPELRRLDRGFPEIRQELLGLLPDKGAIPKYHELDAVQYNISAQVEPEKSWKVFYLHAMGDWPAANRARCPKTCDLLEGIPGLFQAFFSILDGGKSVPAHNGPYRGYLRYHLGLVVPEVNPPTIRIKDQYHTWQEGRSILFDDSWNHEVINKSEADRVVLIVDVRRPMPAVFDGMNRFAQAVMRKVYGQQILKKLA